MTKICIVGPSKKYFSGVSAHTIYLANAFSNSNDVSVITLRNILPRFLYPGNNNVDRQDYTIEFKPQIKVFEGMDWNSPISWIKAGRFLKKEKPDIIIMAWWTSAVSHMELFLALANSLNIKAKLILEMHEIVDPLENENFFLRIYSRIMGKMIMNRASAFAVHSTVIRDQAIKIYNLKKENVFVIPIGVYDNNCKAYNRDSARKELGITEEFTILYFGMIRKYKGIPCLVEAFDRLPREIAENSRLIIAGEDWGDEKELKTQIEKSPNNKHITFQPKFIPDSDVPKYFSAADIVVLPYSRSAGSGVASLAMAFGKPIIISDLENTRESLQDYQGSIFVECGNILEITDKISEVYVQYKADRIISYNVPSSFGWDQVTKCFLKAYFQIGNPQKDHVK